MLVSVFLTVRTSQALPYTVSRCRRTIIHPGWDSNTGVNDVSLCVLPSPVNYSAVSVPSGKGAKGSCLGAECVGRKGGKLCPAPSITVPSACPQAGGPRGAIRGLRVWGRGRWGRESFAQACQLQCRQHVGPASHVGCSITQPGPEPITTTSPRL